MRISPAEEIIWKISIGIRTDASAIFKILSTLHKPLGEGNLKEFPNTVEPLLSGRLLSGQTLFGGQPLKSRKNCQLYTVIKTSIQRPPLLSGRGQFLAVPRVVLFCFIPLLKGQEDLKLTFLAR